jgi:hypothetical protein
VTELVVYDLYCGLGGSFQSAAVRVVGTIDADAGTKPGGDWFGKECSTSMSRLYGSKSNSRKAASALIAKIPYALSLYIAQSFKDEEA